MAVTPPHKIPLSVRRMAVAIHEAGHALAAVILERRVIEAVLRPPLGLSGMTRFDGEAEVLLDLSIEADRHCVEDAIVVLLAGQVAEAEYWRKLAAHFTPHITSHRTDDAEITKLRSEFEFTPEREALFIAHYTEKTRRIVLHDHSQMAIEEIAQKLSDNRSVSRDELDEIMIRHQVIRGE